MTAPAIFDDRREPEQVAEYFGAEPGVFVEAGAHEPVYLSQTHHLERVGWRGVLIEPLVENAARLRAQRSAQVFAVAVGAPGSEGQTAPFLVAGPHSTLGAQIKALSTRPVERRMVPVRTMDSILAEAGFERVDFVSIDVEGAELEVLRGFTLERFRPRLVLLEDDVHRLEKHRAMRERGYKLVRRTALNNWYVPANAPFPVSLYGRLQFLRKLYLGMWIRRWQYALRAWRHVRRLES